MKTIWKYTLALGANDVDMPEGAEFRHVAMQYGLPQAWFEVDTKKSKKALHLEVIRTGEEIPKGLTYVATVLDGPKVYHVYKAS